MNSAFFVNPDPSIPVPPEDELVNPDTVYLEDGTGPDYEPESRLIATNGYPMHPRFVDAMDPLTRALHEGWISLSDLRWFAVYKLRINHTPDRPVNGWSAEDVVAEALADVSAALQRDNPPDLSTRDRVRAYVYRSVANRSFNVGRAHKRREAQYRTVSAPWERDPDSALYWEPPAVEHTADRLHEDTAAWLRTVLAPRELDVLDLVYQGYSNTEIGDRLAISGSTVRTVRERIRKKMTLTGVVDARRLSGVVGGEGVSAPEAAFSAAA